MHNTVLDGPCEIDETPLYKQKPGYPHARNYKKQCWLIGIKCRSTGKFVIYPVLWRNKATLLRILLKHVAYGSTIYSDCWSAYINNRTKESHLSDLGYIHYVVNHSFEFVSQISNSIHTNTVERLWGCVKGYIRMLKPKIYIDEYIAKFYLNSIYGKNTVYQKVLEIIRDSK